jgi:foldase protein PrsA
MDMKIRLLSVPVLLALVAILAACGGSQKVPANAVAVVNGTPITQAQFNDYFQQAVANAKAQGQNPAPSTPQYTALRNSTVAELVQIAEAKQQMAKEGVTLTQSDVNKFIANLVKTTYGGSEQKFQAALKKAGLSLKAAQEQVYVRLLATKLHDKVTSSAKVSESDEKAYYKANLAQYTVAAATTRNVAHILVKTRAEANMIEKKLKNGASFAVLAKKYSTDGSAQSGGKICIAKTGQSGACSQTVAPFAKAAFALKVGQISAPVHSPFGWHVITALGPIQQQKAHTQTFAEVKAAIQQALLQQQQGTLWQQWLTDLQNEYKGKVSYQPGYAPPATTALSTTG